jgi:WD repeat-containing protein 81
LPEFFTDPNVIDYSIHTDQGLPPLQTPHSWKCSNGNEFVFWHRMLLESPQVSRNLHNFIDMFFGYLTSGCAAIDAKNVPYLAPASELSRSPIVCLFNSPHPHRKAFAFPGNAPTTLEPSQAFKSSNLYTPHIPTAAQSSDTLIPISNQELSSLVAPPELELTVSEYLVDSADRKAKNSVLANRPQPSNLEISLHALECIVNEQQNLYNLFCILNISIFHFFNLICLEQGK